MTELQEPDIQELPLFQQRPRFVIDEVKVAGHTREVLGILEDGQWHTTNEMLNGCTTHRFSCAVDYLRKQGWEIETRRLDRREFSYRLVGRHEVKRITDTLQSRYYKTGHWRTKRQERIDLDGNRCCFCKAADDPLHVHHWRYDLFKEDLKDLTTLCEDCHCRIHGNPAIRISFPKYAAEPLVEKIRETS